MAISDLPGYVQGYVFNDDAAYYNSVDEYFIDQAGYSDFPASRLEMTGTPTFVDVNLARGIVLDNTVHGYFNPFTMWHGSIIAVMGAPSRFGTNGIMYPLIGGGSSAANNARIQYRRATGADYRHDLIAASAIAFGRNTYGSDAIFANLWSGDQENRNCFAVTVSGTASNGTAVADNDRGIEIFHDVGTTLDRDYATRQRFGNISGSEGSTTAFPNGDTMIFCELHFFDAILTAGDTTAVEAELTALEATYG